MIIYQVLAEKNARSSAFKEKMAIYDQHKDHSPADEDITPDESIASDPPVSKSRPSKSSAKVEPSRKKSRDVASSDSEESLENDEKELHRPLVISSEEDRSVNLTRTRAPAKPRIRAKAGASQSAKTKASRPEEVPVPFGLAAQTVIIHALLSASCD